jgi:hypothetical protein
MYEPEGVADVRMRLALYLGREVPRFEDPVKTVNETLDKAEADSKDAAAYRALLADDRHQIEFREYDYTIKHSGQERVEGDIFDCEVNGIEIPKHVPGRYYCRVEDGLLVVEEAVSR